MRFLTVCFILAFLAFVPAAHGAEILWNTIELRPSGEWDGTTWYALNTPYVSIGAEQMPTGVRFWADASTYMEFAGCLAEGRHGSRRRAFVPCSHRRPRLQSPNATASVNQWSLFSQDSFSFPASTIKIGLLCRPKRRGFQHRKKTCLRLFAMPPRR